MRNLTAILLLGLGATGLAQEPARQPAQEDVVRRFLRAFFTENEKELVSLTAGRAASDFKAYFWIRRKIHGEAQSGSPRWEGRIEMAGKARQMVQSTEVELTQQEADVIQVKVDGKPFQVGLDLENRVILFNEPRR